MGILEKQTLGCVEYHLIDDMAPTYSATTGTVAISTLSGEIFSCLYYYDWGVYLRDTIQGSIYSYDNTATEDFEVNSWVNMDDITWVAGETNGFNTSGVTAEHLGLAFEHVGDFLTTSTHTYRNESSRGSGMEAAPARRNTVPRNYNGANIGTIGSGTDMCSILSHRLMSLDGRDGDYVNCGNRRTEEEHQAARVSQRHNQLTSRIINKPIRLDESWNSGSSDTNGWTVVNDDSSQWWVGTAKKRTGTYGMYISDDSGTTNNYDQAGTSQVSHFYKDITFPNNLDPNKDIELDFLWSGDGEAGFDYGNVYWAPTSATTVAGTAIDGSYLIGDAQYENVSPGWARSNIVIDTGDALNGQTKRLIFSWRNNNSSGVNPPIAIDDIRFHFYTNTWTLPVPPPEEVVLIDDGWETGSITSSGWTVTNDTTNKWEIGTAVVDTGTYGVYGSDDGGTTSGYQNGPNASHFWKDFTIPSGALTATLTFRWNCNMDDNSAGATQYDYGTVNVIDTTTTPVAGTEVSTALATTGNGRINEDGTNIGKYNSDYKQGGTYANTWFTDTIDLANYIGTTKRYVWTFKDDGANPSDLAPVFAIDNIKIAYTI